MLLLLGFLLARFSSFVDGQLTPKFYDQTCPSLTSTVTSTMKSLSTASNVVPPSTLRLFVHDCFVQGCDASILIKSTPDNQAERDASDNKNLPQNAFDAVIKAKAAVEAICPGVVSCSDVLALAARDVVVFLGGPSWDVPLGRRDGLVSKASLVPGHLPGSNFNVAQLVSNFASVGLTQDDLVILSGGHTVGFSHCDQFSNRLYNFNTSVSTDPSLDPSFAKTLEGKCPQGGGGSTFQPFDLVSPFKFDNQYFINLQSGKGLLFSDQVLFQEPATKALVDSLAASQDLFFKNFVNAMIKMSLIGVKTGSNGEIRKDCTAFNTLNSSNTPSSPLSATPPPFLSASPPVASPNVPSKSPAPISVSSPPHPLNPGPIVEPPPINPNPRVNQPPTPTTPSAPSIPISNPNPVSNPSSGFPPPTSDSPPFTPVIPAPDPDTSSPPASKPPGRFPGLPFNFPKFPRFPRFPRFPGFPGSPGSPGSRNQDVRSTPAGHSAASTITQRRGGTGQA